MPAAHSRFLTRLAAELAAAAGPALPGTLTVTRRLTPAELADWQPLFDNAKKMRTLLAELQQLTVTIAEASQPGGQ